MRWSLRLRLSLLLQPRKGCFEVRQGDRTFASILVHPCTCTHHLLQMVLQHCIFVPCTNSPLHFVCTHSSLPLPSEGACSFVQLLDKALLAWPAHTVLAIALQDMPRPFKKLREHDIDALAEEIAAALK